MLGSRDIQVIEETDDGPGTSGEHNSGGRGRLRPLPAAPLRRSSSTTPSWSGAAGTSKLSEVAARARRQSQGGAVRGRRAAMPLVGNALASRTRFAKAFGVTPQKLLPEILRRLRTQAGVHRGRPRRGAGAGGRDDRRRHRSHQAAGASAARQGRRPLHLRRHGFRARSGDRPDQCRAAPLHAARPRHHRHRSRRAERPAQHLSRDARARRAAADERRGRRPSGRLFRRHHAHAGRRAGAARLAARRADAGGEERHQRPARAGRRRMGARRLSRRGRLQGAGRPLRRIPRLLRRRQDQSGVPRHRDHAPARRAVPDAHHRRRRP